MQLIRVDFLEPDGSIEDDAFAQTDFEVDIVQYMEGAVERVQFGDINHDFEAIGFNYCCGGKQAV